MTVLPPTHKGSRYGNFVSLALSAIIRIFPPPTTPSPKASCARTRRPVRYDLNRNTRAIRHAKQCALMNFSSALARAYQGPTNTSLDAHRPANHWSFLDSKNQTHRRHFHDAVPADGLIIHDDVVEGNGLGRFYQDSRVLL